MIFKQLENLSPADRCNVLKSVSELAEKQLKGVVSVEELRQYSKETNGDLIIECFAEFLKNSRKAIAS